jgi:hypothetical protein
MQGQYIGLSGFYVVARLLALVHPGQRAAAHVQHQDREQQAGTASIRAARKVLRPWHQKEGRGRSLPPAAPTPQQQVSLSLPEVQALGQQLCAMSWGDLHGLPEVANQANLEKYCLWGQYVSALVGAHGLRLTAPGNSFSIGEEDTCLYAFHLRVSGVLLWDTMTRAHVSTTLALCLQAVEMLVGHLEHCWLSCLGWRQACWQALLAAAIWVASGSC